MDITELLSAVQRGDTDAKEQLFEHLCSELRSVAHTKMKHERAGHTWRTSDLLQEVVLRLHVDKIWLKAPNRLYLYAAGARAMYRLLVDYARSRRNAPDGPPRERIPLDDIQVALEAEGLTVCEYHDACETLRAINAAAATAIILRTFSMLTYREIGDYLEVTERQVEDHLHFARAWFRRLRRED